MINNEFNPWVRRIPIIAMSVVVLYSLLAHASFYHYQLWNCPNRKHLILVILVVLNWILIKKEAFWFYFVTLVLLLLASFNVLNLQHVQRSFFLRLGSLHTPKIDFIALGILLVYLRINYDIVIGWLKALEDRFPVEE